jgi:hypothetical protein
MVCAIAVSTGVAQQPNSAAASLTINGTDGPPFPIVGVFVYGGTNALLEINGGTNVNFLVAQSPSLTSVPFPFLGGDVDIDLSDPSQVEIVMDGFGVAPWEFITDGTGHFERPLPVPSSISTNLSVALQGAVADPGTPFGVVLTGASSILAQPGLNTINYILGDDNCIQTNTSNQFGFNIPFYSTTFNHCWVCANGYITFGSASTDFTPTIAKMHSQVPRISMYWCDLDPTVAGAGPITLVVDQIDPAHPVMTFKYVNIPDWPVGVNGGLAYHTFGARIDITSGNVEIHEFANNSNSNYDILIGMSRGNGLDPTGAGAMDLSAQFAAGPYLGLPNEGMYEGFRGVTSITGAFPLGQNYDLAGNFWRYSAVQSALQGAYYIMDFFLPVDPSNP